MSIKADRKNRNVDFTIDDIYKIDGHNPGEASEVVVIQLDSFVRIPNECHAVCRYRPREC